VTDPAAGRRPGQPADADRVAPFAGPETPRSLVELVNRVLDRGVVLQGDVTISVAGVDLVYLGLNALLTSVSTARRTLGRPVGGTLSRPSLPGPAQPQTELPLWSTPASTVPASPAEPDSATRIDPDAPGVAAAAAAERFRDVAGDALASRLVEVAEAMPSRVELDPEGVQRDLGRLVLTIVELLRQVVEHQAVRRMEDEDLSEAQVERMGLALLRLEEKMREIKGVFGLADEELNIDLGPLGKLL